MFVLLWLKPCVSGRLSYPGHPGHQNKGFSLSQTLGGQFSALVRAQETLLGHAGKEKAIVPGNHTVTGG